MDELVEWRTSESEVSGSNPWAHDLLLEQKPVLYDEWSGMMETHAQYCYYGGVFDFSVEQP